MPKRGNRRCAGADCAGNGFNEATSLMEDGFRYIVDSWDAVYKIDVRPLCARPNHAARVARLIAERLIGVACIRGYPKARSTMIELAWLWLRHQPDSPLSIWFRER